MGFNVLIVDDSAAIRKIIKKTILISGFDVENFYEAGNGKEAFNILKDNWVDVVLTDIHMPEMGGITLLKKIREDDVLSSLPVIVISTEGREQKVKEALNLGANGYIKKPFKPEDIKDILLKVMGEEYVRKEDFGTVGECDF
ncbi:MAG TPA: response regulator [Candidatus Desulfofervidus auxilii]|uniref:Response regulator n=1 Tax=Desulfofervidus auxilii TaxID=1621989 RepID=A0A7C0YB36_DESA2|nr:response regulator [Candidatus Desulfofervidus auxilii]